MRRKLLIGLLAALIIGSGTAIAETPSKPFKGSFTAVDSPVEPTPECPILVAGTVEGRATHLGVFSGPTVTCAFNLKVMDNPPFFPGGGPPYLVADFTNEATWIAANGDELEIEAAGVFVQSLPDGISGVRGTITAVGGTGRFADATAEAQGRRVGDKPVTFEGWIDYDASDVSGA